MGRKIARKPSTEKKKNRLKKRVNVCLLEGANSMGFKGQKKGEIKNEPAGNWRAQSYQEG